MVNLSSPELWLRRWEGEQTYRRPLPISNRKLLTSVPSPPLKRRRATQAPEYVEAEYKKCGLRRTVQIMHVSISVACFYN